jgi:hypothetical protein
MGNVLQSDKQQQIVALGRLGWSLRRIEQQTGIRRETASAYLRAAGMAVRGRGRPSERTAKPAIPSPVVSTDPPAPPPAEAPAERAPSASACEPFLTVIEEALGVGPAVPERLAHPEPASMHPDRAGTDRAPPQTRALPVNGASLKPQGTSTPPPHPATGC